MENWRIPTELYTIDVELPKLAISQSDLRQKDLEVTNASITTRVQSLLSLFISIATASIGFCLSHLSDGIYILLPTGAAIIYSLLINKFLLDKAYTGQYIPNGITPSNLFPKKLLEAPESVNKLQSLYLVILSGYDKGIKANREENTRRWKVIKTATTWGVFMPVALAAIYLAVQIFQHPNF
jgi:hypothetical protein